MWNSIAVWGGLSKGSYNKNWKKKNNLKLYLNKRGITLLNPITRTGPIIIHNRMYIILLQEVQAGFRSSIDHINNL